MTRRHQWEFLNMLIGGHWSRRYEHDFKDAYQEGVRWATERLRGELSRCRDLVSRNRYPDETGR